MNKRNHHQSIRMIKHLLILIVLITLLSSCAQLPESSVKLSNSIAEDLVSMQMAHKDFVNYYFDGLEKQVNALIDNKYRPSLIRQVIEQDVMVFKEPDKRVNSLFNAIQIAFIDNQNLSQNELNVAQENAMAGMKIFYTKIDTKVQLERKKLLEPLRKQRQNLLDDINANYINIIKKNATITALLNSVVEVYDAQQQLLEMAGVEENIRKEVGDKLTNISDKVNEIQNMVDEKSSQAEDIEKVINELKKLIDKK